MQFAHRDADIEVGLKSTALCHLANIANQLGRAVRFDPAAETIVGDEQAENMLSRKYREGGHWSVPAGV